MSLNNKFWWFVAVSLFITIVIFAGAFLLFWYEITLEQKDLITQLFKEYFTYIFGAGILLLACLGFALDGVFHNYIIPIAKLTEEATLITSVNPSHRVKVDGSKDVVLLGQLLNELADQHEILKTNVQAEVDRAKAETEEEKDILSQIMAELPEGVLICNTQGRVLLYNRQAKRFFGTEARGEGPGTSERFIGLGRSIFDVVDKHLIVHALNELSTKLDQNETSPLSSFVLADQTGQLLRVEASPILNQEKEFAGFVLICFDITHQLNADTSLESFIQSLTKDMRSPLAAIRTAIETTLEFPDIGDKGLLKLRDIIHKESISLSNILNKATAEYPGHIRTQWPLTPIAAMPFVETLSQRAREKLEFSIHFKPQDFAGWIKLDIYSLSLAMLFVLDNLRSRHQVDTVSLKIAQDAGYLNLDIVWQGNPVRVEQLRKWESSTLSAGEESMPLTLKEVLDHHNAEICSYFDAPDKSAYLRLLIPLVEAREPQPVRRLTILHQSRPEFYDFDLFNRPGTSRAQDYTPLNELTYTVFDTETTGLDPRGGDKIISIGAIRVVNGRLLQGEIFDRLVDPERPLSQDSIDIHGIQPDMLKGQPTIKEVLPMFKRFVGNTILVAHNAAFDMRMLEMEQEATAVVFQNPVLDTLLLSAVVNPTQKDHNLEGIAQRLGISIIGRHTALGDAVTTGEIFLKFISLLGEIGIRTLKQAREASKKSYYARLKY